MQDHQLKEGQYVEKRFSASPDEIDVKQPDDGRTVVRMPISSTAEDRDGDEFSQQGLENERDQINDGKVPAFLDHGRGSRGSYYGVLGMVGTWDNASIETESYDKADDEDEEDEDSEIDVLYADFVPTKANEDAAEVVALAEDGMPIGASVGFRINDYEYLDDEGKFRFHAVDLLETSLVGIPSNPVTVNDGPDAVAAKAMGSPQPRGQGQRPVTHQNLDSVEEAQRQAGQWVGGGAHSNDIGFSVTSAEVGEHTHPSAAAGIPDDVHSLDGKIYDEIQELRDLIEALEGDSAVEIDGRELTDHINESREDTDPDESMSDDNNGGDDPANDDELRETVREQTESNRKLAESIETLADSLGGEKDTDPSGEEGEDEGGTEGKDTDPDDDQAVQLFVGDDADDDVRKEFEALEERATDDGELDLEEAKTLLYDDSDVEDDDEEGGEKGSTGGGNEVTI